jgi:endoglucanase
MRSLRLAIASFIFGLAGCSDTQTEALMPSTNDSSSQAKVLAWLEKYPTAIWLNYNNTGSSVREYVREQIGSFSSKHQDFTPILVIYAIPDRDVGQYSAGGAPTRDKYLDYVRGVAEGTGSRPAIVILEPDSLGLLERMASSEERIRTLRNAVAILAEHQNIRAYVDGTHSAWVPAPEMAERLRKIGIEKVRGVALNVSNFQPRESEIRYCEQLAGYIPGLHCVIDTSRNGARVDTTSGEYWCNPRDAVLGELPTTDTGYPLVDAYLWVKRPQDSDGACNGGPEAGQIFPEQAVRLVTRSKHWRG